MGFCFFLRIFVFFLGFITENEMVSLESVGYSALSVSGMSHFTKSFLHKGHFPFVFAKSMLNSKHVLKYLACCIFTTCLSMISSFPTCSSSIFSIDAFTSNLNCSL